MDDSTPEIFGSKRKRFKKWWEQLSYLEQKLFVALGIISTLLFLIVLILIIKSGSSPKICVSSNCIIAAAEIVKHINPTVDPCYDFYQFTCQKLNEPSGQNLLLTSEQIENELINLLMVPVNDKDNHQLNIQKDLFRMCLNKSEGEESLITMKTILKELHGWPVTLGFNWKAGSFDWIKTSIQLRHMGLPFDMLISVELIPSENANKHILIIGQPKVPKIAHENRHEYRRLMSEVAVAFGAEKGRAANEMRRVLDFIVELEKLTEIDHLNRKIKMAEMQNYFTDINWIKFVNAILEPSSSILPENYVLAPSQYFMDKFLNLLNRTPKRIQANYMIWVIVEKYLPFLSDKLRHLHSNYIHGIDFINASPERWHVHQCNNLVSNSFLTPPSELIYAQYHLGMNKTDKVLNMGQYLQKAFEMFLKEDLWFHENIRMEALSKIQSLRVLGGLHLDLQQMQTPFVDEGKSFLFNLINNFKNKYESIYGQLYLDFPIMPLPIYSTDVTYLPRSNVLLLPVVAYLEGFPLYLNYGEIGTVISQKLLHEILPKKNLLWTNKTMDSRNCILLNDKSTDVENILDVLGILLSHIAYQLWTYDHNQEERLIGIRYTPNQLFWISAFRGYCTKHLNNNYLVNTITQAHPNFAEDFKCPWKSSMNKLVKCNIF